MPRGRPSLYSPELATRICEQLIDGRSLRSVCRDDDMPALSTVLLWLRKHDDFSAQYEKAAEERSYAHAEDILDIADDPVEDVQRSRLRVDTRKWLMSKLAPRKYGDRLLAEHTGKDGAPIEHAVPADSDFAKAIVGLISAVNKP